MELPKDKFDFATVETLNKLPVEAIAPHIPELLVWLQDTNWPISKPVANLLSKQRKELIEPIRTVLYGNDAIWKKGIISDLVCNTDSEVRLSLSDELMRIANHPTKEEKEEETDLAARDAIFLLNYNDQQ